MKGNEYRRKSFTKTSGTAHYFSLFSFTLAGFITCTTSIAAEAMIISPQCICTVYRAVSCNCGALIPDFTCTPPLSKGNPADKFKPPSLTAYIAMTPQARFNPLNMLALGKLGLLLP